MSKLRDRVTSCDVSDLRLREISVDMGPELSLEVARTMSWRICVATTRSPVLRLDSTQMGAEYTPYLHTCTHAHNGSRTHRGQA